MRTPPALVPWSHAHSLPCAACAIVCTAPWPPSSSPSSPSAPPAVAVRAAARSGAVVTAGSSPRPSLPPRRHRRRDGWPPRGPAGAGAGAVVAAAAALAAVAAARANAIRVTACAAATVPAAALAAAPSRRCRPRCRSCRRGIAAAVAAIVAIVAAVAASPSPPSLPPLSPPAPSDSTAPPPPPSTPTNDSEGRTVRALSLRMRTPTRERRPNAPSIVACRPRNACQRPVDCFPSCALIPVTVVLS